MTDQPIVNTTTGRLRGQAEDGLLAFRGIPYAAPPVGPARWRAARSHPCERARTRPVRVYQFEVTSPLAAGALGATRCLDLPFTFASMDRWAGAPFIQGLRDDVTGRVTGALHDAWIAFARDGDPSHPGIPPWHPYDTEGRAVLVITDDDIRVVPSPPVPAACTGE